MGVKSRSISDNCGRTDGSDGCGEPMFFKPNCLFLTKALKYLLLCAFYLPAAARVYIRRNRRKLVGGEFVRRELFLRPLPQIGSFNHPSGPCFLLLDPPPELFHRTAKRWRPISV